MRTLSIAAVISLSTVTSAFSITGDELFSSCTGENPVAGYFCSGYIGGVIDGQLDGARTAVAATADTRLSGRQVQDSVSDIMGFCLPADTTAEQTFGIVIEYMRENPAERRKEITTLVSDALSATFPSSCE